MKHNGTEVKSMTYNGRAVNSWVHNGVEVYVPTYNISITLKAYTWGRAHLEIDGQMYNNAGNSDTTSNKQFKKGTKILCRVAADEVGAVSRVRVNGEEVYSNASTTFGAWTYVVTKDANIEVGYSLAAGGTRYGVIEITEH